VVFAAAPLDISGYVFWMMEDLRGKAFKAKDEVEVEVEASAEGAQHLGGANLANVDQSGNGPHTASEPTL